jgi:TetR/AcrR family transcriptional regulator, ethionamide resistance regulator
MLQSVSQRVNNPLFGAFKQRGAPAVAQPQTRHPKLATKAPTRRSKARHSREEVREGIVTAATELVRERSFYELSVGDVMERAGFERTIFYRHFDDLADVLLRAATEAIERLLAAQMEMAPTIEDGSYDSVRRVVENSVEIYAEHGPLIRAVTEAGASNPQVAEQGAQMRASFNRFTARSLARTPQLRNSPPADFEESARALNLLSESYLRDAFGWEPRVSRKTAVQTLAEIWSAFLEGAAGRAASQASASPDPKDEGGG